MQTPRLVPLQRISATHATYLAGTAAAEDVAIPGPSSWGPRRVDAPADDLREMGIDAAEARRAWRSSEYAHGHDDGLRDGYRQGWAWGLVCGCCLAIGGALVLGLIAGTFG